MLTVPLGQPDGLAGSLAKVIQLRTSGLAAADWSYVDDIRRVNGEDSLDALVVDDAADREVLVDTPALARDYRAGEYLRAFLVALDDSAMHIDHVTHLEVRYFFLQTFTFNGVQQFSFHWYLLLFLGERPQDMQHAKTFIFVT